MDLYCEQCSNKIDSRANFCIYCGAEAPRSTVVFTSDAVPVSHPKYCIHCGMAQDRRALYCSDCGAYIYARPTAEVLYCGWCGKRNSSTVHHCSSCGRSFDDWCAMKGDIATEMGYRGDLTLKEKMTGRVYHFFANPEKITFGLAQDNTIVIPCDWVSRHHCQLDFTNQKLIDSSANGTFINRQPRRIAQAPLNCIKEICIAGSFVFTVHQDDGFLVLHLGAILDEEQCRKRGNSTEFDKLRNHWFISCSGMGKVHIQKFDGVILQKLKPDSQYYTLSYEDGSYYYTDTSRNIQHQLLLAGAANLPKNWQSIID